MDISLISAHNGSCGLKFLYFKINEHKVKLITFRLFKVINLILYSKQIKFWLNAYKI